MTDKPKPKDAISDEKIWEKNKSENYIGVD